MYRGQFVAGVAGDLYLATYGELNGRHAWLYLPPFAEEMNLSRAVVNRQARRFAERGEAVVGLDYFGTGDSAGELDAASVDLWLDDIEQTIEWIWAQGAVSLSLWGLRFGGLLAMTYLARNPAAKLLRLLLWKPVLSGRQMMRQFMRLKQVSESMRSGDKVNWMARVEAGETVEVAGYPVTPTMLSDLSGLAIEAPLPAGLPSCHWIEVGVPRLAPAVEKVATAPVELLYCDAAPFWQNPDTYDAPELIATTLDRTARVGDGG